MLKYYFKSSPVQLRGDCLYPYDGFGTMVLQRETLINKVLEQMNAHNVTNVSESGNFSAYFAGPRGSGKTSIMELLAAKLEQEGYTVFMLDSAACLRGIERDHLTEMLVTHEKVAVLVDEVQMDDTAPLWIALLKPKVKRNLVTIGAGVPLFLPSQISGQFKQKYTASDMFISKDDPDLSNLIRFWQQRAEVVPPTLVEQICHFVRDFCGGHIYPTVKFLEATFTDYKAQIRSFLEFQKWFLSEEFSVSTVYKLVMNRCFQDSMDPELLKTCERALRGQQTASDVTSLSRLGIFDADENFISNLLRTILLRKLKPVLGVGEATTLLKRTEDPFENVENIIVRGLENMHSSDFPASRAELARSNKPHKVEDGVGFSWGLAVEKSISNVFISAQARGQIGRVDFYFNGTADLAIELQLDAKKNGQSQNINEHMHRFVSGNYPWKTFGLLNFALKSEKVILPDDATYHNRVYTFVHAENALYHGNTAIKAPAVMSLTCPPPGVKYVPYSIRTAPNAVLKRELSTVVRVTRAVYLATRRVCL